MTLATPPKGYTPTIQSPNPLLTLVRLLARQAARSDFEARYIAPESEVCCG